MPRFFIIIIVFLFCKIGTAQDYYYYQGRRINLEQRTDRFAVVLKSNSDVSRVLQTVKNRINREDEVKLIEDKVLLINTAKSVSRSDMLAITGNINSIKLITPVYYGESRRVTQIPADRFVVRLRSKSDYQKFQLINIENDISIIGNVHDENGFLLVSNDNVSKNALELSSVYFNSGIFEYAEPDFLYPDYCLLTFTPNDPYYSKQWALTNTGQSVPTGGSAYGDSAYTNGTAGSDIDADLAWSVVNGSNLIKIGVMDTGIDSTHPDFRNGSISYLLPGYDAYFNKNGVPRDSLGHGTCVAGIIAAVKNNGLGVAGVASGCMIMAIKIFNSLGTTSSTAIARAFDTARVKDIDVINNSYNGGTESSVMTNAIVGASLYGKGGKGCVVLFASGNDGRGSPWYPSYLPGVIAVGASTPQDQKKTPGTGNQYFWGGNYGENSVGDLDVVGPTICYTTDCQGGLGYNHEGRPNGDYFGTFGGTSCACPHAAGICALILSANPNLFGSQVTEILCRSCDKIENVPYDVTKPYGKWSYYMGYGRINAYKAVMLANATDVIPPVINHKNIKSLTSTYPVYLHAEIVDQDGSSVPDSLGHQPLLFYRVNKLNNGWSQFDSTGPIEISGNMFTFRIPAMGYETQVQYYFKAEDNLRNTAIFPKGAPDPRWLCYFSNGYIENVSRTIPSFAAADNGPTLSSPVSFDNFTIVNSAVQIFMHHPNISEEIIELVTPDADPNYNRKCLFASNGANGADIIGATVTDSSSLHWLSSAPPYFDGNFESEYRLNGLNGTNAQGDWKILNYDQLSGNAAEFDSVIINLSKLSGLASSCIRVSSYTDSVIQFGQVNYGDSIVRDYHLKNDGTAPLIISGISFAGIFADKFSISEAFSDTVAASDSTTLKVMLRTLVSDGLKVQNSRDNSQSEAAQMIIHNNDPCKSDFTVSLETDNEVPVPKDLFLKIFIQGLYKSDSNLIRPDTVRVYLRNDTPPYDAADSSKLLLDSSGNGRFRFYNSSNSVNYFLQIVHRNSLETWSSHPQMFTNNQMNYDFTLSDTSAYGNNQKRLDTVYNKFGIYSGDADRSGLIELTDIIIVFNQANVFTLGYLDSDINNDGITDVSDLVITYNNAFYFVAAIKP